LLQLQPIYANLLIFFLSKIKMKENNLIIKKEVISNIKKLNNRNISNNILNKYKNNIEIDKSKYTRKLKHKNISSYSS